MERAYRFALEMYGEGAIATYSLLEVDEIEATRARIREAYQVLGDPARRREYDLSRGLVSTGLAASSLPGAGQDRRGRGGRRRPISICRTCCHGGLPAHPRGARHLAARHRRRRARSASASWSTSRKTGLPYLPAPVYLRGFLQEYARVSAWTPGRSCSLHGPAGQAG